MLRARAHLRLRLQHRPIRLRDLRRPVRGRERRVPEVHLEEPRLVDRRRRRRSGPRTGQEAKGAGVLGEGEARALRGEGEGGEVRVRVGVRFEEDLHGVVREEVGEEDVGTGLVVGLGELLSSSMRRAGRNGRTSFF